MEIRDCPECGVETVYVGLALWGDGEEAVSIAQCEAAECSWVGIEVEYWPAEALRSTAVLREHFA